MIPEILLVVGSPRGRKSVSHTLAEYLGGQLRDRKVSVRTLYLAGMRNSPERQKEFQDSLSRSGLTVFLFPLYADQLPSIVVEALEDWADQRSVNPLGSDRKLAAVVNCGFPEAGQNDAALAVMERFAAVEGFEWLGGLTLGGGGGIPPGDSLTRMGGMAANLRWALDLSAISLAAGLPLPGEAWQAVRKPLMPAWLYLFFGNLGWYWGAWKSGVLTRLRDKPYEAPAPSARK